MLFDRAYTDYQLKRSWFRKIIRKIFLWHAKRYVIGKAIDFGCGVGELLKVLPVGSVGLEVNEETVRYCNGIGLHVKEYNPEKDKYQFKAFEIGKYESFIMADVLEHIKDPDKVMDLIFKSCQRLKVKRIILILPGGKGFAFDNTHDTFIDLKFLKRYKIDQRTDYFIKKTQYFPIMFRRGGDIFTHNKFVIIFDENF